ncbi:unnamed protein product [Rotaria magnacalcarata]|uniref:Ty3 transposon capsid-like protein domain-containing protein n=1 Tax=Rotaria magnacalcarata TaxID=392030 RepID=A0A819VJ06_9BILA|nr:unnamed protein product [Rotaria magnacalcarata]
MQTAHVPECNRLDLISYSLRGDALQWYRNNTCTLTSWSLFVQEIKRAFTSSFCEELAFKTLESYTQSVNQSVRNFYNEVIKLCKQADPSMSESTKLKNLLNKVKPSIQFEVRKKKPKTTVEFLEYAKEVEELLQLSSTNVDTHTSYDSKPTNMVRTTNTSSNLSSYYSNNSNNNYSSTPYRNSRINTPSYTSASHKSDVATTSRAQPSNSNYQFQSKKYTSLSQNHTHNINSQKQKNIQQYTNTSKKDSKTKSRSVNAIVSPALSSDCIDGVAPFQVLGLVNLSVQFNNFHSTITAHVAQHLCADMILGMDYINKYNMSISVKKQIVSLELNQQRTIVPIVNVTKPTKIPVVISNTVFLSPRATKEIVVSIPISSISLPFTLLSSFKSHICVTNDTKTLHFQNYRCTIKLRNLRKDSKFIRKGAHIGDLLYTSTFQQPRIFCSSCYKSNGTTKNLGMTSAFSNLNTIRNFSSREKISTSSKLCDPSAVNYLHLLVKDIENKQQKQHILSLLLNFYDIFDITKHNIAQTPKSHVINTIPHSPPSSRPYPQPDKEEAIVPIIYILRYSENHVYLFMNDAPLLIQISTFPHYGISSYSLYG